MINSDKIIALNDRGNKAQAMHVDNEDGKAVVAQIVTNIVDLVCRKCTSFDHCFNCFSIVNSANFRTAHSVTNNDELSKDAFTIQSSSDSSDDEFDRILENTRRQMSLQREEEDDDIEIAFSAKTNAKLVEHEYDIMPAIEELRIHVEEDILLEQFGRIVNIVDRLVVIEADSNIALDFDTVIFDIERNAVGRVFDIFGPVIKPMYAILFNDIKEASEWRVGSAMYYAPAASQFTHTVLTEKLRQEKASDGCWDGEGECPDEMLAFSDDEAEQRYKAKHRSANKNQYMFHSPRNKKARYSYMHDRSKCRNSRRHNIMRQFRNGSEYDSNAIGNNLEQNPIQQSSWSAVVNKGGFQPDLWECQNA